MVMLRAECHPAEMHPIVKPLWDSALFYGGSTDLRFRTHGPCTICRLAPNLSIASSELPGNRIPVANTSGSRDTVSAVCTVSYTP